jgi:hypothetical protein
MTLRSSVLEIWISKFKRRNGTAELVPNMRVIVDQMRCGIGVLLVEIVLTKVSKL